MKNKNQKKKKKKNKIKKPKKKKKKLNNPMFISKNPKILLALLTY